MINRNSAPELQLIDRLDINNYKKTSLSNGVDVYYVDSNQEELIRIELRFRAGRWYEPQQAVSRAVCPHRPLAVPRGQERDGIASRRHRARPPSGPRAYASRRRPPPDACRVSR